MKRGPRRDGEMLMPDGKCPWCNKAEDAKHRCPMLAIAVMSAEGVQAKAMWTALYEDHDLDKDVVWGALPDGRRMLRPTVRALLCIAQWAACTAASARVIETGLKCLLDHEGVAFARKNHRLQPLYRQLPKSIRVELDAVHVSLNEKYGVWDSREHGSVARIVKRYDKAYVQNRYIEEVGNRTVLWEGELRPPFPLFMLMETLVLHLGDTVMDGIQRQGIDFPFGWWSGTLVPSANQTD